MEEDTNSLFNNIRWIIGCPEEKGWYWITISMKSCEYEAYLAKFDGNTFHPVTRPDLMPIEASDVVAYVPFTQPAPCKNVLRNKCPFCNKPGHIVFGPTPQDDLVSCFECEYTVHRYRWESSTSAMFNRCLT